MVVGSFGVIVTVVLGAIFASGTITDVKAGESRCVDGVRDCDISIVRWIHDPVSGQAISVRVGGRVKEEFN